MEDADSPETAALKDEEKALKAEQKALLKARVQKRRLEVEELLQSDSTPAAASASAGSTPASAVAAGLSASAVAPADLSAATPLAMETAPIQQQHTKTTLPVAIEAPKKARQICEQPSQLPAELRGLFLLDETTEEATITQATGITIHEDSGDVTFDLDGGVEVETMASVFDLAIAVQEHMMDTYPFSVVSLFVKRWIHQHMTQKVGLHINLRTVHKIASCFVPGEGKCAQSHLSDIANGLVAMTDKPRCVHRSPTAPSPHTRQPSYHTYVY